MKTGQCLMKICQPLWRSLRTASTAQSRTERLKIHAQPPRIIHNDWIGPPDPESNLRPIRFHVPEYETTVERELREQREQLQTWNQEFWAKHNNSFLKLKKEFTEQELQKKSAEDGGNDKLTAEEIAVFYKKFLDDNYQLHLHYNIAWYKKNISLLWPAFRVAVHRLVRKYHPEKKRKCPVMMKQIQSHRRKP